MDPDSKPVGENGDAREPLLVTTDSYEEYEKELLVQNNDDASNNRISEIQSKSSAINESTNPPTQPSSSKSGELHLSKEDLTADNIEVFCEEEYWKNKDWLAKERHVFVLSSAGKPIYSRHGSEDKLVAVFGVMQALTSFVQLDNDVIRSIHAGDTTFVFLSKGPLILVCISKSTDSVPQIIMLLTYVFNQICSVLTYSQLNRIFEQRRNYDLRRMLQGSERLIDHLITFVERDPACVLSAIKCLPLKPCFRDTITNTIMSACSKIKNLVFAILLADNELVTLVRMKKYMIHPSDLHLLFNLVNSTESLKTAETWTPICLPKFDSSGFLHAHVSYLADDCQACLLLLTVDHGAFFTLSEAKQKIAEKLRRSGTCLEAINESMSKKNVVNFELGEIRHFLYKSKTTAQIYYPELKPPYTIADESKRLFSMYSSLHSKLHCAHRPLKVIFQQLEKEKVFGWMTAEIELYVVFEPLVEKQGVVSAIDKLLKWVRKEEEKLFILNAATF